MDEVTKLKAEVYDYLVQIELYQKKIAETNQKIELILQSSKKDVISASKVTTP